MTKKEILKYIKEARHDIQLKNVSMFLIDKRHYAKTITEIETHDIDLLLDNLLFNNDIIDTDNVEEYYLKETINQEKDTRDYKKIVNNNKILLLNYYNIKGKLIWCKIYLDNVNYYNF